MIQYIEHFLSSEEEIEKFMNDYQTQLYNYTIEIIKRLSKDINQTLIRKFSKLFKTDEKWNYRNWIKIEEN